MGGKIMEILAENLIYVPGMAWQKADHEREALRVKLRPAYYEPDDPKCLYRNDVDRSNKLNGFIVDLCSKFEQQVSGLINPNSLEYNNDLKYLNEDQIADHAQTLKLQELLQAFWGTYDTAIFDGCGLLIQKLTDKLRVGLAVGQSIPALRENPQGDFFNLLETNPYKSEYDFEALWQKLQDLADEPDNDFRGYLHFANAGDPDFNNYLVIQEYVKPVQSNDSSQLKLANRLSAADKFGSNYEYHNRDHWEKDNTFTAGEMTFVDGDALAGNYEEPQDDLVRPEEQTEKEMTFKLSPLMNTLRKGAFFDQKLFYDQIRRGCAEMRKKSRFTLVSETFDDLSYFEDLYSSCSGFALFRDLLLLSDEAAQESQENYIQNVKVEDLYWQNPKLVKG